MAGTSVAGWSDVAALEVIAAHAQQRGPLLPVLHGSRRRKDPNSRSSNRKSSP